VAGALSATGCGDDVNDAQDEVQRQAEDFTQGIPQEARDARRQAEEAAGQIQQQIDDLTNGAGN
jgi:flagellar hook-basal body complex protein FliE